MDVVDEDATESDGESVKLVKVWISVVGRLERVNANSPPEEFLGLLQTVKPGRKGGFRLFRRDSWIRTTSGLSSLMNS